MENYLYLGAAGLLACLALAALLRLMPQLTTPSAKRTKPEFAVLATLTALGLFTVYFNFYAEGSAFAYGTGDFGTDTYEQYLPFYVNLIDSIRSGTFSLWNPEFGLGTSTAAVQSWAFDPFNAFLVPFVLAAGNTHLSLGLVLSQSLKVVLSVFLFSHLLTRFCEQPLTRILGALLYGFSGFMMMYGQHYWLGSVYPAFTLSVLLFELFLERASAGRFAALTLTTAYLMAWSPYIAFMVLLFDAFYLLFRIPAVKGRLGAAGFARQVGIMCLPVFCGGLLAGAGLVPYVLYLVGETARTGSDASLVQRVAEGLVGFISPSDFLATLSRMLGSGLVNNGSAGWGIMEQQGAKVVFDAYEFILLGYSAGAFILLSQFFHWAATEADRRTRALIAAATALVVLFCVNFFLPLLFTGMVRVQYRCSFILNVPIVIACAIGWEKRIAAGKAAQAPLWGAVALTLAVLGWSLANAATSKYAAAFFIAAALASAAVFVLMRLGKVGANVALALLVACFFSTSVADAFSYTNLRILLQAEDVPGAVEEARDQDTLDALAYLAESDPSLHRVDKTYAEWTPHNDSLIQHFDGASAYDSSPDADVAEFYEKLWPDAVVGGVAWSKSYKEDPDETNVARAVGLKYVLSKEPLDYPWLSLQESFGEVKVYRNEAVGSIAFLATKVVAESDADALASAAERRELIADAVIVPDEVAERFDHDASGVEATDASSAEATEATGSIEVCQEASDRIAGTISCSTTSMVHLAIPHIAGWEVLVDGQPVETFRSDYGFYGFEASAGDHTFEAHFVPRGLHAGVAVSMCGLAAFAACCALLARKAPRPS